MKFLSKLDIHKYSNWSEPFNTINGYLVQKRNCLRCGHLDRRICWAS